jgi:multidrug resistance efflux pump
MSEQSFAANPSRSEAKRSSLHSEPKRWHPAILRFSGLGVAGLLSTLMVTAVLPPIVADQSDRAVVNAPVTLLTAPINGEIEQLTVRPGSDVGAGEKLAQISNPRLDRSTLISLEEKAGDAREKLDATKAKRQSDITYVAALDREIADQTTQLRAQLQSQIEELRARVAQSTAMGDEKKALVDRQNKMVARDAASQDMVKPTIQQYSAALHNTDAEGAKLRQKIAQFDALNRGIYVGEDLIGINNLFQKRRDIDLDANRMDIEGNQESAVLAGLQHIIDAERHRLSSLAAADVVSSTHGRILSIGAAAGRHVNAGDSIASVVDCDKRFVVAIFSYRQGQNMKVGARVHIEGSAFSSGIVSEVLPKTSDKVDERFAVPFPQTERRELYAIITPDAADQEDARARAADTPNQACSVGQWVTVTRDNGVVPSMSVTWRRLEEHLAFWVDGDRPGAAPDASTRREGFARVQTALRSPAKQPEPALDSDQDWLSRARTMFSR